MASVLFIIRVPYERDSESTKTEGKNESFIEETEGEGLTGSTDEQDVEEVKFEIDKKTDKRSDENEAAVGDDITNEAAQSAHDVEMFAGPLNLAQVLLVSVVCGFLEYMLPISFRHSLAFVKSG